MGEIRLTCPECGTGYRLAEGAIPAAGRNVECSACGHVWYQSGDQERAVDARPAPDLPNSQTSQLNRPLPAAVLSVLREEAELARRQRGPQSATTVIETTASDTAPAQPLTSGHPPAGPAPSRHINTQPPAPPQIPPAHAAMEATVNRTTPHRTTHLPEGKGASATSQSSAYARGMRWSAGIAAALLALYLVAPRLADQGAAGAQVMEWRVAVDHGRLWLSDRMGGLFDGNAD